MIIEADRVVRQPTPVVDRIDVLGCPPPRQVLVRRAAELHRHVLRLRLRVQAGRAVPGAALPEAGADLGFGRIVASENIRGTEYEYVSEN